MPNKPVACLRRRFKLALGTLPPRPADGLARFCARVLAVSQNLHGGGVEDDNIGEEAGL